jgi:3-oxoacyl-(acyl-carrier-protein) synthase III
MRPYISDIEVYLPERVVTSFELETIINKGGKLLDTGSVERLFGVCERRYADPTEQVSDLGANAARNMVEKHGAREIDCLIFASACSDLIEPATANIVHSKLGLECPAFDVKNACNSFVTALQVASSFIESGVYKKILIASGEKLSNTIRFDPADEHELKRGLASLSFGDAGSAVMVEPSPNGCGIHFQRFKTVGKHWNLCTILGGGSMFPFDPEKNYFEGKTSELANVFVREGRSFVLASLSEAGWALEEIDYFFTHQVSSKTIELLAMCLGIPIGKMIWVSDQLGNVASVSIPLSLHVANTKGMLKHGNKIAIIGLAAGISISVQLMVWK